MIIAVDRAGFVGEDGETHQGLYDVSLMQGIPGLTVYSPATYNELSSCLYRALYRDNNVVIIRYPRGRMDDSIIEIESSGDSVIIGNPDADISIVTYGKLFFEAIKAKQIFDEKNIDVKIIKLLKIKPIDKESYLSAINSNYVFFFEEAVKNGGAGEVFGAELLEYGFKGKFILQSVDNEFVSHASVASLMKKYKLDYESMVEIILKELKDE